MLPDTATRVGDRALAARPRGLEPAPDVAKDELVGRRQVVEEQPPYAVLVGQPGDFDLLLSGRRQLGVQPAATLLSARRET